MGMEPSFLYRDIHDGNVLQLTTKSSYCATELRHSCAHTARNIRGVRFRNCRGRIAVRSSPGCST